MRYRTPLFLPRSDAHRPGPWPLWPNIFCVSSAHEEGGVRLYAIATQQFTGDERGRVTTLHAAKVETVNKNGRLEFKTIEGSELEIKPDPAGCSTSSASARPSAATCGATRSG